MLHLTKDNNSPVLHPLPYISMSSAGTQLQA
jgi:hypothetical protein